MKNIFVALLSVTLPLHFANGAESRKGTKSMQGALIYVVHGYMASPHDHWFEWLKTQAEKNGARVEILDLPDSKAPRADVWKTFVRQKIAAPNEKIFIVGHSLGCITTLNFLSELPKETRIGGLICVAGFSESLPTIPSLDGFTSKKYDIERVKMIATKRAVIVSDNDSIVSPAITIRLAKELDAPVTQIVKGGHFLGSDGFKELPAVLEQLTKMVKL